MVNNIGFRSEFSMSEYIGWRKKFQDTIFQPFVQKSSMNEFSPNSVYGVVSRSSSAAVANFWQPSRGFRFCGAGSKLAFPNWLEVWPVIVLRYGRWRPSDSSKSTAQNKRPGQASRQVTAYHMSRYIVTNDMRAISRAVTGSLYHTRPLSLHLYVQHVFK